MYCIQSLISQKKQQRMMVSQKGTTSVKDSQHQSQASVNQKPLQGIVAHPTQKYPTSSKSLKLTCSPTEPASTKVPQLKKSPRVLLTSDRSTIGIPSTFVKRKMSAQNILQSQDKSAVKIPSLTTLQVSQITIPQKQALLKVNKNHQPKLTRIDLEAKPKAGLSKKTPSKKLLLSDRKKDSQKPLQFQQQSGGPDTGTHKSSKVSAQCSSFSDFSASQISYAQQYHSNQVKIKPKSPNNGGITMAAYKPLKSQRRNKEKKLGSDRGELPQPENLLSVSQMVSQMVESPSKAMKQSCEKFKSQKKFGSSTDVVNLLSTKGSFSQMQAQKSLKDLHIASLALIDLQSQFQSDPVSELLSRQGGEGEDQEDDQMTKDIDEVDCRHHFQSEDQCGSGSFDLMQPLGLGMPSVVTAPRSLHTRHFSFNSGIQSTKLIHKKVALCGLQDNQRPTRLLQASERSSDQKYLSPVSVQAQPQHQIKSLSSEIQTMMTEQPIANDLHSPVFSQIQKFKTVKKDKRLQMMQGPHCKKLRGAQLFPTFQPLLELKPASALHNAVKSIRLQKPTSSDPDGISQLNHLSPPKSSMTILSKDLKIASDSTPTIQTSGASSQKPYDLLSSATGPNESNATGPNESPIMQEFRNNHDLQNMKSKVTAELKNPTKIFITSGISRQQGLSQLASANLIARASGLVPLQHQSNLLNKSPESDHTTRKKINKGYEENVSQCSCPKHLFEDRFWLCIHATKWLKLVEQRTDTRVDYERARDVYQRVQQRKSISQHEEKLIKVDILRTFPEEAFFISLEGRQAMTTLLNTLSKHSSSAGYTQGMNNIAGSLLHHSNEVLAFELVIRLLNDYHLKEVHMIKLPGLYHHCEILEHILADQLPDLAQHLKLHQVSVILFSQNWIMCLFTQVIPLTLIQQFYSIFFQHEWVAAYRIVLVLLSDLESQLLECTSSLQIQVLLKQSYALKASQSMLSETERGKNYQYWVKVLEQVEMNLRFRCVTDEYVQRIKVARNIV